MVPTDNSKARQEVCNVFDRVGRFFYDHPRRDRMHSSVDFSNTVLASEISVVDGLSSKAWLEHSAGPQSGAEAETRVIGCRHDENLTKRRVAANFARSALDS